MPKWILNIREYACTCRNMHERLVFAFPHFNPLSTWSMITYYNVYTKLEQTWRNMRIFSWRDKIWFFLQYLKVFDFFFVLDWIYLQVRSLRFCCYFCGPGAKGREFRYNLLKSRESPLELILTSQIPNTKLLEVSLM